MTYLASIMCITFVKFNIRTPPIIADKDSIKNATNSPFISRDDLFKNLQWLDENDENVRKENKA
jgi:hypothetical protein